MSSTKEKISKVAPKLLPLSAPLIARICHLTILLEHLPSSLPYNPSTSTYLFELDPELEGEEGTFAAFSWALEHAFQTHKLSPDRQLVFVECGQQCKDLIMFLKRELRKMDKNDREAAQSAWLERLVKAAQTSGAKVPKKR